MLVGRRLYPLRRRHGAGQVRVDRGDGEAQEEIGKPPRCFLVAAARLSLLVYAVKSSMHASLVAGHPRGCVAKWIKRTVIC
jgi:hypothetical protein